MVVCKEEGKSSRLQTFCRCVLGGTIVQSELCTYKNGTEKYFYLCLICDNGKFMAGGCETNSEGFLSVGSNSHSKSPGSISSAGLEPRARCRSRRLLLELWAVRYLTVTGAGRRSGWGHLLILLAVLGEFRESCVQYLLTLLPWHLPLPPLFLRKQPGAGEQYGGWQWLFEKVHTSFQITVDNCYQLR